MSKFYYDADDLGYEIVGARFPRPGKETLPLQKENSSSQFSEPNSSNVVYSCDPPRVTPGVGRARGTYTVDPDGSGPLPGQTVLPGRDGKLHYRIPGAAGESAQNWVINTNGTGAQQEAAPAPVPPAPTPVPPRPQTQIDAAPEGTRLAPGETPTGMTAQPGRIYVRMPATGNIAGVTRVNSQWGTAAAPAARHRTGAQDPNAVTSAPSGTPAMGANETQLRHTLEGKNLTPGEIDAFMARFPADGPGRAHTTREAQIGEYLAPGNRVPVSRGPDRRDAAHQPERMETPDLRANVRDNLRDQALRNMRNAHPPITDQQAYDYLAANGLINTTDTAHPRPATATPLGRTTGNDWPTREISNSQARDLASNPIFTASPGSAVTSGNLNADIQRHHYVDEARTRYTEWAQRPRDANPNPGLGLNAEQANARFNERATQLGLMQRNQDGSYSVDRSWRPNDTDPNSPAQSFFRNNSAQGQAVRFQPDGSILPEDAATFRHEDPLAGTAGHPAVDPTNRVDRVAREAAAQTLSRDALYATMTGQTPEGSLLHVVTEGEGAERKHFLVGPNPQGGSDIRQEIHVMNQPLSRDEALANLQAVHLTDAEGRPLPGVSADTINARTAAIVSGQEGRSHMLYETAQWEQGQIWAGLNRLGASEQASRRMMNQNGWLGAHPNVEQMEQFRRELAHATTGSTEAGNIMARVNAADRTGSEPTGQVERDNAADLHDSTNTARRTAEDRNAAEGRTNRTSNRSEAERNRENALEVERMRTESAEREGRANRQNTREVETQRQDAEDNRQRERLAHESAEKALDRRAQIMQAMLQMLTQMISSALQAMTGVAQSSIQGSQQLSAQTIGGIRAGRG